MAKTKTDRLLDRTTNHLVKLLNLPLSSGAQHLIRDTLRDLLTKANS